MVRGLSDQFMSDLQNGILSDLLKRIKCDDTLMLAIRDNYINIYYRGGNILKLSESGKSSIYDASFDVEYSKIKEVQEQISILLPKKIENSLHVQDWVKQFSFLKEIMDNYFAKNQKLEREFQQLVARENNSSTISNETEYFIADIELANSEIGARFDMLAFKWLASDRKKGNVRLALIEMKYGDKALDGESGVAKHLDDIVKFAPMVKDFAAKAQTQINQLNALGLLKHTKGTERVFEIDSERIEIIFLFANSNPRSTKLDSILKQFTVNIPKNINLRFFVASSAGYAMHDACMYTLEEYTEFTKKMMSRKNLF